MYLLPDTVNMLKDKFLAELKPGTRIISHDYPLTGWIPEKYVQMDLEDKVQISGVTTTLIYLYVVPAKVGGQLERADAAGGEQGAGDAARCKQQLTRVSGSARLDGKDVPLEDVQAARRPPHLQARAAARASSRGQVKGKADRGHRRRRQGGAWRRLERCGGISRWSASASIPRSCARSATTRRRARSKSRCPTARSTSTSASIPRSTAASWRRPTRPRFFDDKIDEEYTPKPVK